MIIDFATYEHHGVKVWVKHTIMGKHRQFCLCYSCKNFHPDNTPELSNCPIAERVYQTCIAHGLTTPVMECPKFVFDRTQELKYLINGE